MVGSVVDAEEAPGTQLPNENEGVARTPTSLSGGGARPRSPNLPLIRQHRCGCTQWLWRPKRNSLVPCRDHEVTWCSSVGTAPVAQQPCSCCCLTVVQHEACDKGRGRKRCGGDMFNSPLHCPRFSKPCRPRMSVRIAVRVGRFCGAVLFGNTCSICG